MFSFRWQVTVRSIALFVVLCCLWETVPSACGEDVYREQVTPILIKYCAGCHNDTDREGDLSLASYEGILRGNEDGPVIRPGESRKSRLVEVLQPGADPKMPPEDRKSPASALPVQSRSSNRARLDAGWPWQILVAFVWFKITDARNRSLFRNLPERLPRLVSHPTRRGC